MTAIIDKNGNLKTTAATPVAVVDGGTGQTSYTNGQLLIGNTTGNTLTKASLTAGTNIAVTNGAGSITVGITGQIPVANGGTAVAVIPKFSAYLGSAQNVSTSTYTKINFNGENFDTNGNYDNATNYRFTPTVAGKYLVTTFLVMLTAAATYTQRILLYKNGAENQKAEYVVGWIGGAAYTINLTTIVDMNGSTDYLEVYAWQNSGSTQQVNGAVDTMFAASLLV